MYIYFMKQFDHFPLTFCVSGYSCCGTVRVIPRHSCSPCATTRRSSTSRSYRSVTLHNTVTLRCRAYVMLTCKIHWIKAQWGRSLLYSLRKVHNSKLCWQIDFFRIVKLVMISCCSLNACCRSWLASPVKKHTCPCKFQAGPTFSKCSEIQLNLLV